MRRFGWVLVAGLVLACSGESADPPAPPATEDPATTTEDPGETTAQPEAPTCEATGGIWTVATTVTGGGADACGYSGRASASLASSPVDSAMSAEKCDISRSVTDDGCSVLCKKHSATPGMQVEMLITYESPSRFSGYAVLTGNNLRCEYDLTYTKS